MPNKMRIAPLVITLTLLSLLLLVGCQPIASGGIAADTPAATETDAESSDASSTDAVEGLPPVPEMSTNECRALLATTNDFVRADDYAALVELIDIVTDCDISDDLKAGMLFMRADANMQQGDWNAAVDDYREALALGLEFSDAAGARNNICWFLALDGQAEEALPYCEQAVESVPSASYIDSRALAYAQLGNIEGAIEDFETVLEMWEDNENPEIRELYDQRMEWLEILRDGENPFTPELLSQLQAQDAPQLSANLESDTDSQATEHLLRGRQYHIYSQLDEALEEYTAAIELDSEYALAYFYRGLVYRWQGEWQKALDDMRQVIELNPEQAFAHHVAGLMHMRLDADAEAVDAFTDAIELMPNEPSFYADRAAAYFALDEWAAALEDLNMTLLLDPDTPEMLFMRGAAHRALGNNGAAIADLELAIELGLPESLLEQAEQALLELRQGFFTDSRISNKITTIR